jgi:small-conductance mechanosensitive channel
MDFNITELLNDTFWKNLIKGLTFLAISLPIILFVRKWLRSAISKNYGPHYGMLASKVAYYFLFSIVMVVFLTEMGFKLGPLLGAAGVLGVAIGFASQTSVSNIISGFFLIAEKPFEVGDVVNVGDVTGVVLSIDTLSVKLRMFDNRFVRIPNEMIIKQVVTNITRFPIRRVDIKVSFAYKEDIQRVKSILMDIADKNPLALQEPSPTINFDMYNSSSVDLNFLVWCAREDFIAVRNSLNETIKKRFDEESIEIPFPHMSIYAGELSKPISVQLSYASQEAQAHAIAQLSIKAP